MLSHRIFISAAICSVLLACAPKPVMLGNKILGNNVTGAAVAATPATFGVTSITTGGAQMACTEPRPSAAIEITRAASGALEGDLDVEQKTALIAGLTGLAASVQNIEEVSEYESVEFISHGLFGICQIYAGMDGFPSDDGLRVLEMLVSELILQASSLGSSPTTDPAASRAASASARAVSGS